MEGTIINIVFEGETHPFKIDGVIESKYYEYTPQFSSSIGKTDKKRKYMQLLDAHLPPGDTIPVVLTRISGWFIKHNDEIEIFLNRTKLCLTYLGKEIKFAHANDTIYKLIPLIVKAYTGAHWQKNIKMGEGENLNTLNAKAEALMASAPQTPPEKQIPTDITKYNYLSVIVEVDSVKYRATKLPKLTWQFAVIPAGKPLNIHLQTTINFADNKPEVKDYTTPIYTLNPDDLIRVEVGYQELMIRVSNVCKITPAWINDSIAPLVRELCTYTVKNCHSYSVSGKATHLLTLAHHANKAIKAREHKFDIINAKNDTLAQQKTKFLCGLAQKSQVYGINTIRFGSLIKNCVINLVVPGKESKTFDITKLSVCKVMRITLSGQNRVEISKAIATFSCVASELEVKIESQFNEYYITYEGQVIDHHPKGIEFEFMKSDSSDDTFN